MMEKAVLVKISGRVTGVGFRYSTLYEAAKYPKLRGYVRNVGYGQVEALVQGTEEDVDRLIVWLREGPSLARVDEFLLNEMPVNANLGLFTIR